MKQLFIYIINVLYYFLSASDPVTLGRIFFSIFFCWFKFINKGIKPTITAITMINIFKSTPIEKLGENNFMISAGISNATNKVTHGSTIDNATVCNVFKSI